MPNHSLAQQRAQHALAAISAIEPLGPGGGGYGNYLGYVKAMPANVRSLGLGQALAFALAKAEGNLQKPYGLLYGHITGWLCSRSIYTAATPQNFMRKLVEGEQRSYLEAQIETMAYLEWLKKFAVASLRKGEEAEE